jgi:phosphatidylinositol alpha-1,6-mannosyltransferase
MPAAAVRVLPILAAVTGIRGGAGSRLLMGLTGLRVDGGIASVARCIARALDEECERGHLDRVDRVLLQEDPADPAPPPVRGEQRLSRDSQSRCVWQLWRSYRRHRHDLVFFDQLGLARSVGAPLPGFPPSRYAIFCHGIELDRVGTGPRRKVLAGAWRLLANSPHTAATLRERFPEVADRVVVTTLCIDPERARAWEREIADPPLPREPAALIVGRMWSEEPGKGHDALIEAWPEVLGRVPGAELWVTGAGDDRERLEAKARELAGDSVRFLGRVSDPELSRLFQRASVLAMPSQQEGFGLVYAEAMWHGLPCIGSTADAAGDVISDGETGVLVPYGDVPALANAVSAFLSDPERVARMGEAGRRRAREHFGYSRFRDDVLAALALDGGA